MFLYFFGEWLRAWVPVVGPLGTFGVVVVAFIAYLQKVSADKRAQWWTRAQWGIEAASDDRDRRTQQLGVVVLTSLRSSKLATAKDQQLLAKIVGLTRDDLLDEVIEVGQDGDEGTSGGESFSGTNQ